MFQVIFSLYVFVAYTSGIRSGEIPLELSYPLSQLGGPSTDVDVQFQGSAASSTPGLKRLMYKIVFKVNKKYQEQCVREYGEARVRDLISEFQRIKGEYVSCSVQLKH